MRFYIITLQTFECVDVCLTHVTVASVLTRSRRDSSMLFDCSLSLKSSRSTRRLSMSADRCGMLDTQATVRSDAAEGVLRVDGDFEP